MLWSEKCKCGLEFWPKDATKYHITAREGWKNGSNLFFPTQWDRVFCSCFGLPFLSTASSVNPLFYLFSVSYFGGEKREGVEKKKKNLPASTPTFCFPLLFCQWSKTVATDWDFVIRQLFLILVLTWGSWDLKRIMTFFFFHSWKKLQREFLWQKSVDCLEQPECTGLQLPPVLWSGLNTSRFEGQCRCNILVN